MSSSRLRSQRSAALPVHGTSTRIGTNWQKFNTPSKSAECVWR